MTVYDLLGKLDEDMAEACFEIELVDTMTDYSFLIGASDIYDDDEEFDYFVDLDYFSLSINEALNIPRITVYAEFDAKDIRIMQLKDELKNRKRKNRD